MSLSIAFAVAAASLASADDRWATVADAVAVGDVKGAGLDRPSGADDDDSGERLCSSLGAPSFGSGGKDSPSRP
jgi:hypothetical protein